MPEFVSGPLNLVRLEGNIEGTKKVFYMFMDIHLDITIQRECEDIYSKPIKLFLAETFKNLDKEADFFVETFPDAYTYNMKYTEKYLLQVRKLFSKIFEYDDKKNTVLKSTEFPNVRFHYMDIRSYLSLARGNPFAIMNNLTQYFYKLKNYNIYPNDLKTLIDGTSIVMAKSYVLYSALYPKDKKNTKKVNLVHKNNEKIAKYTEKDYIEGINYIISKLTGPYNHKSVKDVIMKYINGELKTKFEHYFALLLELKKTLEEYIPSIDKNPDDLIKYNNEHNYFYKHHFLMSNDIYDTLNEYIMQIDDEHQLINMMVTDFFFLRRALDKKYIENGITYTGFDHTCFYMLFLVKEFGFKITHANDNKENLDKIHDIIKKANNLVELREQFLPTKLTQCIDISKFPPLFT